MNPFATLLARGDLLITAMCQLATSHRVSPATYTDLWASGRRALAVRFGVRPDGSALRVARLSRRGLALTVAACAMLWPAIGLFLKTYTDTDVPWWDAFPTAVSLVGQFLLGRKYIENWAVWIIVNVVSVGLFAYKGLWLTLGLYLVFIALSVVGWRAWRKKL